MQHYQPISFAGPNSLTNANGTATIGAPQDVQQQQHQHQHQHQQHQHQQHQQHPQHQHQHQQHQQHQQAQLSPQQQHQQVHQQQQQQPQQPLVATGDWTKDLVHLAKTAELKKHALTLQLHTAHVLSAHASLEQKSKALQDLREQKNKIESERTRLLNSLREINEDRDKADLMEVTLNKECSELRLTITNITEGDYALAKQDVDRLRQELGMPPMPSLQTTLEKSAQYISHLNQRRPDGDKSAGSAAGTTKRVAAGPAAATGGAGASGVSSVPGGGAGVAAAGTAAATGAAPSAKRPRGRPKGSKNKTAAAGAGAGAGPGAGAGAGAGAAGAGASAGAAGAASASSAR